MKHYWYVINLRTGYCCSYLYESFSDVCKAYQRAVAMNPGVKFSVGDYYVRQA